MKNIKVSVLIYVLNDATHIEKCIQSVRMQTLQEIEILIIDGGSTDGTLDMIKKFAQMDGRIRVIPCSSGVGLQFNTGLREAKGKYIGICESDDYLLPHMYEEQYKIVKKYQLDFLKANVNRFCEADGKEIYFPFTLSNVDSMYHTVINAKHDRRLLKLGVNGFWSGLYRRDFLLDNKIFMNETKGAAYQDIAFTFLTAIKAERVMLLKKSFYCYRMDNPNSSVNSPQKLRMLIEEYALLKKRLKEDGLFEEYKEIYLAWKINGHLWFYDNLSVERKKDYIEIMYEDICGELSLEKYQEKELQPKEKCTLEQIKISKEAFKNYIDESDMIIAQMKKSMEQIDGTKEVIIFGSGNLGRLVALYLEETGRKVAAYIDNAEELWGKTERYIPILQPRLAVNKYPHAWFVIANMAHFQEMKEQLMDLSVNEKRILICNHYDVFLKHILIKAWKEKHAND